MRKDDASLVARDAAAARAADFGDDIAAEDVTVRLLEQPVAGHWVFVASWGHPRIGEGIAGVVTPEGEAVTYPNVALARLWAESEQAAGGEEPRKLAQAAAALLAGPLAHHVLVDDRDFAAATGDQAAREKLGPPVRRDGAAGPSLVFWWNRRGDVSEMTLTLDPDAERVETSERFLRDMER